MSRLDANLKMRLDYEINMLERAKKEYSDRLYYLRDFQGAFMKWSKRGRRKYYYIKRSGSSSYKYIGKTGLKDVERVKEVHFLEEVIGRINHNLELLKSCADDYLPFDASSICDSLPKVYRCKVPPVSELYKIQSEQWLNRRLEDQKLFPENYTEKKRHTTSDGVKVKTVSEVVLYEMIKDAGLALIYELPIPMKDYGPPLYPDATVLSPIDMKTEIIVEYVGRLDLYEYRVDFAKRVARYIDSGYIPGVNLFFVFSDSKGNVDTHQIKKVIADIFGIRKGTAFK